MHETGCSVFKQKYLHFLCELLNAGFQYCEFSVSVRHYKKFPRKHNMIKYPCVASGSEFMIVRFVLFVVPQTLEPQILTGLYLLHRRNLPIKPPLINPIKLMSPTQFLIFRQIKPFTHVQNRTLKIHYA